MRLRRNESRVNAQATSCPYGEPVDLAPRFAPYEKCPPLGRVMLIGHTGRMLENLMQDVRLLGS